MVMNVNPLLLAQTPVAQHLANAEQSHPEVAQGAAAHEAVVAQEKDRSKVQKTDETEGSLQVKEDQGGSGGRQEAGGRRSGKESDKEHGEEHAEQRAASPWAGHIVNVTI